ncbi:MAG: hypothetical protein K5889_00565 [Lachnospiraceae bacterium]|nr:hypothetical protein [Lachnospiraceae bacterium]
MTWRESLLKEIEEKLGEDKARHFDTAILPNIVADFIREMKKGKGMVSETYHLDDGSFSVVISGSSPENIKAKLQ